MFNKTICEKTMNELYEISYNNPPYLTPRQFTISIASITNVLGDIPKGLAIALAVAAKYYLEETNLTNEHINDQVEKFTKEIDDYLSSFRNRMEDALYYVLIHWYNQATGESAIGGPINLANKNCVEDGQHY